MLIRFNLLIKKALSFGLTVFIAVYFVGTAAASAPDRLYKDYINKSNTNKLIDLDNNLKQKNTTSDSDFLIQGTGKEGTEVTVYSYNDSKGWYEKRVNVYDEDSDSEVIGSLGVFAIQVELSKENRGINKLWIVAQKGKLLQIKRIEVILNPNGSTIYFEKNQFTSFSEVMNSFKDK